MKDAECAESNEKPIFRLLRFLRYGRFVHRQNIPQMEFSIGEIFRRWNFPRWNSPTTLYPFSRSRLLQHTLQLRHLSHTAVTPNTAVTPHTAVTPLHTAVTPLQLRHLCRVAETAITQKQLFMNLECFISSEFLQPNSID